MSQVGDDSDEPWATALVTSPATASRMALSTDTSDPKSTLSLTSSQRSGALSRNDSTLSYYRDISDADVFGGGSRSNRSGIPRRPKRGYQDISIDPHLDAQFQGFTFKNVYGLEEHNRGIKEKVKIGQEKEPDESLPSSTMSSGRNSLIDRLVAGYRPALDPSSSQVAVGPEILIAPSGTVADNSNKDK